MWRQIFHFINCVFILHLIVWFLLFRAFWGSMRFLWWRFWLFRFCVFLWFFVTWKNRVWLFITFFIYFLVLVKQELSLLLSCKHLSFFENFLFLFLLSSDLFLFLFFIKVMLIFNDCTWIRNEFHGKSETVNKSSCVNVDYFFWRNSIFNRFRTLT